MMSKRTPTTASLGTKLIKMIKTRQLNALPPGAKTVEWMVGGQEHGHVVYICEVLDDVCLHCGKRVIIALPPPVLALQPDDTTHVCYPSFGGCNLGYWCNRGSLVTTLAKAKAKAKVMR